MTTTHGFFGDATDVRYYSQIRWLPFVRDFSTNGYVVDNSNQLVVSAQSPAAMAVNVATGAARNQGNYYGSNAVEEMTIEAAHATLGRIDRIVLRNDITGSRKTALAVLKGTAAISPSAPALTRTADTWELCLADITVGAAVTSIAADKITDRRSDTTLCGTATPSAVRFADIIPGDEFDMSGNVINGVATPTADTDGVSLAYRNTLALEEPVGIIDIFAGGDIPEGYLECNGDAVSRSTYAALFSAIGTTFGVGDGTTTFNVPDLCGRVIAGYTASEAEFDAIGEIGGEKTHVLTTAEIPSHTHTVTENVPTAGIADGVYTVNGAAASTSTANAGSGTAHNNLPPCMVMKMIIKTGV